MLLDETLLALETAAGAIWLYQPHLDELHLAVVTNTVPVTGTVLPFVSYGGSGTGRLLQNCHFAENLAGQHQVGAIVKDDQRQGVLRLELVDDVTCGLLHLLQPAALHGSTPVEHQAQVERQALTPGLFGG